MLTAKFHFVDLAGSERLKRTGATGGNEQIVRLNVKKELKGLKDLLSIIEDEDNFCGYYQLSC